MLKLKRIRQDAIGAALDKALRYRLLNEPRESESICLDVLAVEPENQQALVTLLLALSDQFEAEYVRAFQRAQELVPQIRDAYEKSYYDGIVHERWAKAQLARHVPVHVALSWLRNAMRCYEQAEQLSPADNPDAVLRWNTCARLMERLEQLGPSVSGMSRNVEESFGDDVPAR
jgi:hypothetical protein